MDLEEFDTRELAIGMFGATLPLKHGLGMAKGAQIAMIERRILRLEMALRRAGFEVEEIPLREIV